MGAGNLKADLLHSERPEFIVVPVLEYLTQYFDENWLFYFFGDESFFMWEGLSPNSLQKISVDDQKLGAALGKRPM